MHLDYEITPQDLAALRAQILGVAPAWKRWAEAIVVGAICSLILVVVDRRSQYGLHWPSALGGILTVTLTFIVLQKQRMRQVQPAEKGYVLGSKRAVLLAQGVQLSGEGYELTIQWKAIRRMSETPEHLFLWVDRSVGFCLPKRAFTGESTKAAFVAELRKNTGL